MAIFLTRAFSVRQAKYWTLRSLVACVCFCTRPSQGKDRSIKVKFGEGRRERKREGNEGERTRKSLFLQLSVFRTLILTCYIAIADLDSFSLTSTLEG